MEKIATCFLGDRMIVKQNGRNERTPIKGIATFFEFQQHNVIYLDITSFVSSAGRQGISLQEIPNIIVNALHEKFLSLNPNLPVEKSLTDLSICCTEKKEGEPFIFIIDEWDAVIHGAKDD